MGEKGQTAKNSFLNYNTHVFIDVSNIRSACLRSLGFLIDFPKLLDYLYNKYPKLQVARYYEGIAKNDTKKLQAFGLLESKGYTVCSLERKIYNSVEENERVVKCPKCGNNWPVKFARKRKAMKSNVDVYLASDMLELVAMSKTPLNLVLISCDGDYAEAIRSVIKVSPQSHVTVLATPMTQKNNSLSVRLKDLSRKLPRNNYQLINIQDIQGLITAEG